MFLRDRCKTSVHCRLLQCSKCTAMPYLHWMQHFCKVPKYKKAFKSEQASSMRGKRCIQIYIW